MGVLRRFIDAFVRTWRELQAISELDTEGEYPLDLRLLDADVGPYMPLDEVALEYALQEVRAGRIPKRSRKALRDAFVERVAWLGPPWSVIGVLLLGVVPGSIAARSPPCVILLYFVLLIGGLLVPTVLWWRLRRDVREQRLRIEEGELTRKWIRPALRPKASVDVMCVRIGGHWHDVRSPALFAQLGFGVRYRMYVSAHAGRLIAIESVEREAPAGYRDAPAGAPRLAPMNEPGDRAQRGAWPTPRELPDRLPEVSDDETMPLEGVEAFIDGALVMPGGEA